MSMALGQALRGYRKSHRCTQERFAEQAGVDIKHLQRLEKVKQPVDVRMSTFVKLAKTMRCDPSDLLRSMLYVDVYQGNTLERD